MSTDYKSQLEQIVEAQRRRLMVSKRVEVAREALKAAREELSVAERDLDEAICGQGELPLEDE